MGIFSFLFLMGFVSTSSGNFCSKRFTNGKWISHGDCGEKPDRGSITNDLAKGVSCPVVLPSAGLTIGCSGVKYGDTCNFDCKKGFNMNGVGRSITCDREGATGRWSGTIPTCLSVSCPAVQPSDGLKIDCTGTKYGDKCKFSCEKGYNMNGVGVSITCDQDGATGRWIGTVPTCSSVSCPTVQLSDGLKIDCTGSKYGDKCNLSCEKGFNMNGFGDSITCDQDGASGRWSGAIPTCLRVSCSAVLPSEGLRIDCTGTKYGDTCKFSCEKGFNMNGVGDSITCDQDGATGRWIGTVPTCLSVSCPAVQQSEGLNIVCTGTKYGDECKFYCQKGFNMNGVGDSITCDQEGATGRWSGTIPTCLSVSCPAVQPSEGLNIVCTGTKYGDNCKFSCDKGFNMNSVGDSITCDQEGATGKWNGTQPACISVSCPALHPSDGLNIVCTGAKYGDNCKFSCEKGFNMNGVGPSITCDRDGATGKWSGTIPTCLRVASKCESQGGHYSRQKCYTIPHISSSFDTNYDEAVSECAKHGALLADIHDRQQQNELQDFALSKMPAGIDYVHIWVGMEYQSSTSKLLYRSGKRIPTNQLQWYLSYPHLSYDKYLILLVRNDGDSSFGLWNYYKWYNTHGALCEKEI